VYFRPVPELPEVEILVRHLLPALRGKTIRGVRVFRAKVLRPTSVSKLKRTLTGAKFTGLDRRGKFLLFQLRGREQKPFTLLGHLGMTGRMYLAGSGAVLPKHASVVLELGTGKFVFEDTRYFGRFTLDTRMLQKLGPEPLAPDFVAEHLQKALRRSGQAIKVRLLDQSLVAGLGNIYASEVLFRAGISPRLAARTLLPEQVERLWRAIREVLAEAIECGSTVPLNFGAARVGDRLFYFGRAPGAPDYYAERLRVYDRAGAPCPECGTPIRRFVQAARSTYYCPRCQRGRNQNRARQEPRIS
jgi:formamidopyrimidine-DNA glycosylase